MTTHTTTHVTIQPMLVAALASAALLVVLVLFAGWALAAPAYDPGLIPTSEPQVPPMAWSPADRPPVPSGERM